MKFAFSLPLLIAARLATAQTGATVTGVVRDSIDGAPLAGALVEIASSEHRAGADRSATSDSLGRFILSDVPDGRFTIGFFHPTLEVLGIEAPVHEVRVADHQPVRVDLATPSARRLHAAICGPRSPADSGSLIVGVVRDALANTPVDGAKVKGQWYEFSLTNQGLTRDNPQLIATTKDNGWFAMCDAPRNTAIALSASHGADSTDRIEVQVPPGGFVRSVIYLGSAKAVVTGTVVAAETGKPMAGAQVGIINGPQTRTNDRGEWTITDAPAGTRILEVRALGYFPERRRVDVVSGIGSIKTSLATLKSVLDTVKVSAARPLYDRNKIGFEERQRSRVGRFVTPERVARLGVVETTGVFRVMPGVKVSKDWVTGETHIVMRGANHSWCRAAVYIDGFHIPQIAGNEIDKWVRPDEIAGIEVYALLAAPPQYQNTLSGCGSVLVWTKR